MKRVTTIALILACASSPANAGRNFDRAKAADDGWEACVVGEATRLASRADAQSVADAAFGSCDANEAEFRRALAKWAHVSSAELQRQMDQEHQRIRARALAGIVAR